MAASDFTRDVILPSLGRLYPPEMVPGGLVTIRMMDTKDEKILSTGNRSAAERIVTTLLNSVTVSPQGLDTRELLLIDRVYLLIQLRALTFLPEYVYNFACPFPGCKANNSGVVNLDEMPVDMIPDNFEEPIEVKLPLNGDTVYLNLPRGKDEEEIYRENKRMQDKGTLGDNSGIIRMAKYLNRIGDDDTFTLIQKVAYVQKLMSRDSAAIRHAIEKNSFGLDLKIYTECTSCGQDVDLYLPMSDEFFRPSDPT